MVWTKARNIDYGHSLFDIVRGTTKRLISSGTDAESTISGVTSFDSDGFTLGSNANCNESTRTYVGWNWLAGGTASSNTDGSITSQVSASTTSGFSIVSYTGTGANATVGHGLGVAPKMIIIKNRDDGTKSWVVGHQSIGFTKYLVLETTNAEATNSTIFQDTDPTSTVFSLGTNTAVNQSSASTIAYCFADKKGFSKFGSYTGNGSADGTFVYTGMRPAFVLIKQTNTAREWYIFDNKRDAFNPEKTFLEPSTSDADATVNPTLDFVSNGFKLKTTNAAFNDSGGTYIYMCFSEFPLVGTNNVVGCAR